MLLNAGFYPLFIFMGIIPILIIIFLEFFILNLLFSNPNDSTRIFYSVVLANIVSCISGMLLLINFFNSIHTKSDIVLFCAAMTAISIITETYIHLLLLKGKIAQKRIWIASTVINLLTNIGTSVFLYLSLF